jgi:hypothetical protein
MAGARGSLSFRNHMLDPHTSPTKPRNAEISGVFSVATMNDGNRRKTQKLTNKGNYTTHC